MPPLETVQRIEPALLEEWSGEIGDIVAELAAATATLASLVRIMNSYHSNLIEGHNTRPKDIERALAGEFDSDEKRRNLQLEAAAYMRVQAEIDRMATESTLPEPASMQFIQWLHREFYRGAAPKH